jgi:hypothetical protein
LHKNKKRIHYLNRNNNFKTINEEGILMLDILTLIDKIIKQIRQLIQFFETRQETTVDEIESNVWKIMLEIGRLIIEWIIKSRGTGYTQRIISTPSGKALYKGDVPKTITTLMGDITIQRAYYNKINEKGGYVPLDKSFSIPKENCSYAVQEAMSLFAIEDSFAESAKKLSKLFPVKVSESTIRRVTQKYGKDISVSESDEVTAVFSHKQPVPEPDIKSVKRGYVGLDGVMVPTRNGYREMKVITTYDTPVAKDALANNLHDKAMFAKPDELGEHLWLMLKKRGIIDGEEIIWVGDGAIWIWKLKRYHTPDGKEILDFIHAVEHLKDFVNMAYGEETDKSNDWLRIIKIKLREEGGQKVLEELEMLSEKCSKKALEKLKETIVYYRNNVERMDYPVYERAWYHITSSPTESACRHVVGDRLKRSGMRWTEDGAQYVTSLRLKWKNSEWEGGGVVYNYLCKLPSHDTI